MARSTETIDLEEQFHSVKHAIWCLYPTGSKTRVLEDRPNVLVRPSWRVTYLTHRDEQLTSRRYRQVVDWTIDYYGSNRADVMDKMNAFERSMKYGGAKYRLVNLIPAWRFDWQYPSTSIVIPQGGGAIPQGTHQVRISAIDVSGNESAASMPQDVAIADPNNAIGVRIARVPYSSPLFKTFKIYVDDHQEASIDLPARQSYLYPQTLITNLLGTGPAPQEPSDTVRVRWQHLRVTGFAMSSREDDVNDGVYTGNINLQTTVEQEHARVQLPAIEHIEAETSLTPTDRFTIVVEA